MLVKTACDRFYELFISSKKMPPYLIVQEIHRLSKHFFDLEANSLVVNVDEVEALIELERRMFNSKGPEKQYVETKIFDVFLIYVTGSVIYFQMTKDIGTTAVKLYLYWKILSLKYLNSRCLEIILHQKERLWLWRF